MPPKKQAAPPSGHDSLAARYDLLVKEGQVKDDPAQREVLAALQKLSTQLTPESSLAKLFNAAPAQGIYIWGSVGRGKSMLMDLFFQNTPVDKKRRVHFHAFMQEVHARIHKLRQDKQGDPVMVLARQLAEEAPLLCFDELQATDVADATLLYRLFSGLFDSGVTIVSTSNHPPESLYTGGVQRERFDKFIALLEEKMQVLSLSSPKDYRRTQTKSIQQVYFYPLGTAAENFLNDTLKHMGAASPQHATLAVQGHSTTFTLYGDAIGRFTFHELCETARGAGDYLALARRLDTLILTDIPKLPPEKRNEAKRFVTLVDALYEHKVKLICTAAAAPEEIYGDGDGSFEFKRTVSRLIEMQSAKYLES